MRASTLLAVVIVCLPYAVVCSEKKADSGDTLRLLPGRRLTQSAIPLDPAPAGLESPEARGSSSRNDPAPAAVQSGNPSGPWNNMGMSALGALNFTCIPQVDVFTTDQDPVLAILFAFSNPGGLLGVETPVALHIGGSLFYAFWNALATYNNPATPSMQPVWPIPGVTKRTPSNPLDPVTTMVYAVYRLAEAVFPPEFNVLWGSPGPFGPNGLFGYFGLNIKDTSKDPTTAVGVGNLVGADVVEKHTTSKWNALGSIGYAVYKRQYADWTGYEPVNTAYELNDPLKWQPLIETNNRGYFQVQQLITPQAATVDPVLASAAYFRSPNSRAPAPYPDGLNMPSYRAQADFVLSLSAALTDEQKMIAEYFDDKFNSFGVLAMAIASRRRYNSVEKILADMNVPCLTDAVALMWREKQRYEAVRPMTAIRYLYKSSNVNGWVQNLGTQTLPGREWTSYLRTMPHAEYPSFTACTCAVFASYMRALTGSETITDINPITFKAGCSRREPGLTPAQDVTVSFANWTEFETTCAQSRAYAGVHFQTSINVGRQICAPLGSQCYQRVYKLLYGSGSTPGPVPKRGP